jgi:two-component system, cell cycle response regulator DivK
MKKKILLIEDNGPDRDLAIYLLESRGYQVIPAADGALGIEMAVFHQPQVILFDIHLSSMDGSSVAHALRNYPALQSIPRVAVTLYSQTGDQEKAIVSGCNGYMVKPFDPQTFVAEIERYMQQNHHPRTITKFWSWAKWRTSRACGPTSPWAFIPH